MRVAAIAVVLALAAAGGTARADGPASAAGTARADADLAEAIRLEAALDYDHALAIVEKIIAAGTTTEPARLAELHLYGGRLAAGLDRTDAARDHFARALALRPDLALPAGTSPKITAPFEAARATSTPLRVRMTNTGPVAEADALGLVHHADATTAYDAHGNVVWRGEPIQHALPPPPPPPSPGERPGIAGRASTWAIATGGALVIGGLCAWRFEVAQDDWNRFSQDGQHDYSQLRAIEQRGNHWGVAADISFGVAAAAGVTAAILYVVHRPAPVIVGDHYVGVAARF